jgi:hypothetical protein
MTYVVIDGNKDQSQSLIIYICVCVELKWTFGGYTLTKLLEPHGHEKKLLIYAKYFKF